MKKRILSVFAMILASTMVLSLVSCSKSGTTGTKDDVTNEVNEDGSKKWMDIAPANGNADWKLPYYDVAGTNVVWLATSEIKQPDLDKPDSRRDVYKITASTIIASPEEVSNKFISLVMSGESPDIYLSEMNFTLIKKGYVQPWDDYIDFSIGLWKDVIPSLNNLKIDEHYYCIGMRPGRWDLVWYNKSIFEENGVKTPLEYYKEGNWTWDTFRDCAKALTIDADSNGTPEIWGVAIDSLEAFVYTTGKAFITLNPDGTATNNIKSPEIARAMQFTTDLYVKDKVAYDGQDGRDLFVVNQVAMVIGGAWYRSPFVDMIKRDEIFYVPYPKDPQADKYYIFEGIGSEMMAKDCKNPNGAAAYEIGGLYDKKNTDVQIPLTNEEIMAKNSWTLEMENWLWAEFYGPDKVGVLNTSTMFDVGKYGGDMWIRPRNGEPWATVAEELAPQIDDDIANVLNLE